MLLILPTPALPKILLNLMQTSSASSQDVASPLGIILEGQ